MPSRGALIFVQSVGGFAATPACSSSASRSGDVASKIAPSALNARLWQTAASGSRRAVYRAEAAW